MSRTLLLVFCLVIGLLVLACGGPTNKNGAPTNSSSTAANTVPSGEQIGVPECDSFLNAYESCVSTKVPDAQRAQFQTIMTNWRAEWKKLAADPQMKAGLITACKNHMETARTQMKAYNCTF